MITQPDRKIKVDFDAEDNVYQFDINLPRISVDLNGKMWTTLTTLEAEELFFQLNTCLQEFDREEINRSMRKVLE